MKIKKGDNVRIMAGKDRSKSGQVEYVFPERNLLVVKGIHLMKKHLKPSQKNPKGGIIDINKKINVSNVMLLCQNCGKTTRIGYQITDKNKIRICVKCKKSIEKS